MPRCSARIHHRLATFRQPAINPRCSVATAVLGTNFRLRLLFERTATLAWCGEEQRRPTASADLELLRDTAGASVPGATSASFSFVPLLADNNSSIVCYATNTIGVTTYNTNSDTATLTVFLPPTLNLVGQPQSATLVRELEDRLQAQLKRIGDDFRPGKDYIAEWGYEIAAQGSVPYAATITKAQTPRRNPAARPGM